MTLFAARDAVTFTPARAAMIRAALASATVRLREDRFSGQPSSVSTDAQRATSELRIVSKSMPRRALSGVSARRDRTWTTTRTTREELI
jgi:hypothetical protein